MKLILMPLLLSNLAVGQTDFSEKCHSADLTSIEMLKCLHEAQQKWDTRLNDIYQELGTHLNDNQKESLKEVQLRWIQFRDAEEKMIEDIYGSFEGSINRLIIAEKKMEITKKRAVELEDVLRNVKSNE